MRTEQYFLMTDYSLWEVILNEDSHLPTRVVEGVLQPVAPTTAEQKLARKNELKARGTTTQNLAFVSSSNTDSTTESVSVTASVSAVCAKMPVSSLPNVDSLSNVVIYSFFASQSTSPQLDNEDLKKIDVYDLEEMDLRWQMTMECRSPKDSRRNGVAEPQRRTVPVETSTSNALVSQCDGVGSFNWSYQAEEEPANYALMVFSSSSSSSDTEFDIISYQTGIESVEAKLLVYKQNESIFEENIKLLNIEVQLRDSALVTLRQKLEKAEQERDDLKLNFVQSSKQVKSPRHSVQPVETSIPAATPKPASPKSAISGKRRNRKACFVCKSVDHLIKDCDYHAKKMAQPTPRNYAHQGNHKQYASLTHTNPQKHMVPAAVLTQSKPVSIIVVRPVSAVVPKVKAPVVSVAQGMQGKWSNLQHALKDKGVIDSGCSRNMIGNMSYLSDFEELNGGYVAFGGNPKGGKISSKGKIKTCKLDFDDVYFLPDESQVLLRVPRENNMSNVNLKNIVPSRDFTCLFAKATIDESNLWHRRLGHINFKTINKLVKGNLVRGLPTKVFKNDNTCVACKKGKQHRASCKTKLISSVNQPLYRLHMDLFRPTFVTSLNKKSYCLIVTDDYSRFTWVFFLATKYETSRTFITGLENQLSLKVKVIRSDNGTEFKNNDLNQFCRIKGIKRGFSIPKTPQQNSIAERKNKTLIKAAKTMLADSLLPIPFWAEAVNTACYVQNKPNVAGSGPTWLFDIDSLTRTKNYQPVIAGNQTNPSTGFQDKFDTKKAGEEVDQQYVLFPLWSSGSTNPQNNDGDAVFDGKEHDFDAKKPESEVNVSPSSTAQTRKQDDNTKKEAKGKSHVNAAGTIVSTVRKNSPNNTNTFSAAGPLNADASPTYGKSSFIDASQLPDDPDMLELENITYSDDENNVGAEADFNNLETSITVIHIPTTRVHKDHHEEGLDYEEVFAPVARIEAIRLFLAYAFFMGFMMYQMDVKSAFLYRTIEEEVYVCQPPGFEDPDHPDKVYKVVKTLYGLHQAPRAWYETLTNYLLENDFQRGKIDQTLFIKKQKGDILLVQIYVDDIIFGATNKDLCKSFEKLMKDKFQMSSIGELTFFLSLQVKQKKDEIFISQDKYIAEILRKFGLTEGKSASTPIDIEKPLLKDPDVAYSDSDYAGASLDRKSTTGGCQFLGCKLISWQCKKQTVVATSSTEAEYVAAASCCAKALWIQN
nr:putative ribonuclease H-like domain-containing protein [Tanacetum cinerariifolium]